MCNGVLPDASIIFSLLILKHHITLNCVSNYTSLDFKKKRNEQIIYTNVPGASTIYLIANFQSTAVYFHKT
jgi:hypothetical protein